MTSFKQIPAVMGLTLLALAGCDSSGGPGAALDSGISGSGPVATSPAPTSTAPAPSQRSFSTDAMVFVGSGTWSSEVASIESILSTHGATFEEVSSDQLNTMSVDDMLKFGALIMPGGAGGTEAGSLTAATHANLREAVQVGGLNYAGFCAGAFVAVAPAPAAGQDVSYGIGIVNGPLLGYYYLENQGTDIAMTLESFPDGSTEDILWYGGPITPDTNGGVIARYPDGNPAITQLWSGKGFVVISAVHPTATQAILSAVGMSSSDGTHLDLAWQLLDAAIHQKPLPAF